MGKRRRYSSITTAITITTVIAFSVILLALCHIKPPPPPPPTPTPVETPDHDQEETVKVPTIDTTDHHQEEETAGKLVVIEPENREGYSHRWPLFSRRTCNVSVEIIQERDWCTKQFFDPLPRTVSDLQAIVARWGKATFAFLACDDLYSKLNYWPFDYKSLTGDPVVLEDHLGGHRAKYYSVYESDYDHDASDELCLPNASYVQNFVDALTRSINDAHKYSSEEVCCNSATVNLK